MNHDLSIRVIIIAAGILTAVPGISPAGPPYFANVTVEVGLANTPAFRMSTADINNDGYPDLVVHHSTDAATGDVRGKQYVYLNVKGDNPADPFSRKFIDFTVDSGIRANRRGSPDGRHSDGAVFADVDNDGDLDMFNTVYIHRSYTLVTDTNDLMLNDGQGHFTFAPNSPFHLEQVWNSSAAVFVDYDNDGNVDLFVGNWYWNDVLSTALLYRGNGDGSFTNETVSSGIGTGPSCVYGLAAWDWEGDGYTDLFAPSYSHTAGGAKSIHWWNSSGGTFSQWQFMSGYDDFTGFGSGRASFGSMPRDYNNDGNMDYLEILTHGTGDGATGIHTTTVTFDNLSYSWDFARVAGRGIEDPDTTHHGDHYATWLDLDNDGLSDFALTESGYGNNRIYVFKQAPDHTFAGATPDSGLSPINDANLPPHNVLALDYDRDGDEDLLVGFGDNTNGMQVWRNDEGLGNNWITVELEGAGGSGHANRAAAGARVTIEAGGVKQMHEICAGCGHQGPQVPLQAHFGLGAAAPVDTLTVRWPNQDLTTRKLTDVCVNRFLLIREIPTRCADPVLYAYKNGGDVDLAWDESSEPAWWWNVYRGETPDPASWGEPTRCVQDGDLAAAGIQYKDIGALSGPPLYFYRSTAVNDAGETVN